MALVRVDTPSPGDIGLVHKAGSGFVNRLTARLIEFGTDSSVCHAFIYRGNDQIVEAVAHVQVGNVSEYSDITWLHLPNPLNPNAMFQVVAAANTYVGQKYNALDILAIALAQPRLGHIVNGNEWWVKRLSDDHMQICSQLVVNAYRVAGIDLFPGKLSGLISPGDLLKLSE